MAGVDDDGAQDEGSWRDLRSPDDDEGRRHRALWELMLDDEDEDGASTPASTMKELPGFPRSSAPSMHQLRNPSFGSLRRPSAGSSSAVMTRPFMSTPLEGGLCSSPADEFPPDNITDDNGNGLYGDDIEAADSTLSCDGSSMRGRSSGCLVLEEDEFQGTLKVPAGDHQDENEAHEDSNKSLRDPASAAVLTWIPCPCPAASPSSSSGPSSSAQPIATRHSSPLSPSPSLRRSQSWSSSLARAADGSRHWDRLSSSTTTPLFSPDGVATAKSSPAVPPPTASSPPMSFRVKTSRLRTVSCAASAPEVAALLEKTYRLLDQAEGDEDGDSSGLEDSERAFGGRTPRTRKRKRRGAAATGAAAQKTRAEACWRAPQGASRISSLLLLPLTETPSAMLWICMTGRCLVSADPWEARQLTLPLPPLSACRKGSVLGGAVPRQGFRSCADPEICCGAASLAHLLLPGGRSFPKRRWCSLCPFSLSVYFLGF